MLVDYGHTEGVPAWPAVQLHVPSEDAPMLLGSPIGTIVAFFLVQYKEELELKYVSSIAIFRDYESILSAKAEIQFLSHIDQVPEGGMLPEDTEMLDEGKTGAVT
jgi:hypothetical protein